MMVRYLNANSDILGDCEDHRVVEWYSVHFGRVRDQVGRRITKRLGSGKWGTSWLIVLYKSQAGEEAVDGRIVRCSRIKAQRWLYVTCHVRR
jgi:hypothetical protein